MSDFKNKNKDARDLQALVINSARRFLLMQTTQCHRNKTPLLDSNIPHFFAFLSSLVEPQILSRKDLLEQYEDFYDVLPVSELEQLFSLLQTKIYELTEKKLFDDSEINPILRMCNSIMKKLSLTHNTQFRGRVQMLISAALHLTHRSGVNHPGRFNDKNVTTLE